MQADYTLYRDIMWACRDARPSVVAIADLCGKFPDRTDEDICFHVQVLKDEGFVETRDPRSTAGNHPLDVIQCVRLSHPLAAERFLDGPAGPPN